MAIIRKAGGRIRGLSTDPKPTAAAEPLNTVFEETNTGLDYRNTGAAWIPANRPISNVYNYKMYLDGSNTRLVSLNNMATDVSNSDPAVVLNTTAATINANSGVKIMPGTYTLLSPFDYRDKHYFIEGSRSAASGSVGQSGDTIFKAGWDHASQPVINCYNTGYSKQQIRNLVIDCDSRVAYGIDCYDIRERYPFLRDVAIFNADIDGLRLTKCWYTTIEDLVVGHCTNSGMHWNGITGGEMVNTLYVTNSRFTTCGNNILISGAAAGNYVTGCILEGNHTIVPFTNAISSNSVSAFNNTFRDVSAEYVGAVDKEMIYDNGNNNRYINWRFDAYHTAYTAAHFGPNAKNNLIIEPFFQANTANTTAAIVADAGGINNRIVNPTVGVNTPLEIQVKNAGGKYSLLCENLPLFGFHAMDAVVPSPMHMKWGYAGTSGAVFFLGLMSGMSAVGGAAGFAPFVTAENARAIRYTTGTATGDNVGIKTATAYMSNSWNPKLAIRFRIADAANTRLYIGWNTSGADPNGDDPLNALAGILFGKISTNADWVFMHNDATGATVIDPDIGVAADNNIHTLYMEATASSVYWQLDNNNLQKITTEIPAAGSIFSPIFEIETTTTAAKTFDIFEADMRCF